MSEPIILLLYYSRGQGSQFFESCLKLILTYFHVISFRLLVELKCERFYKVENPFDFMEQISMEGKTNFFEKRVGEYQKFGVMNDAVGRTFSTDEDF